jgi:hypothetical protein
MVHAFDLDARPNEIVAKLAAGRPSSNRADALAINGGVEEPAHTSFHAAIESWRR